MDKSADMDKKTPPDTEAKSYRMAGTRADKKAITVYVEASVWRVLKLAAMDSGKSLQDLVADLLKDAAAKPGRKGRGER